MTEKQKHLSILSFFMFSLVFSIILIGTSSAFSFSFNRRKDITQSFTHATPFPCVIIDAGHGGEDGGAIGVNGTLEKDINLSIANELCDMLTASGITVIMTRTEDILLYDRNTDFKGRKKMLDLSARLKTVNETDNCILVSIHMNSFPEAKYKGLQVYYSGNSEYSKTLADSIQEKVKNHLQPNNTRMTKKAEKNIFLLDRCKKPSVLVECGFLSNPEECSLLASEDYRKKLSLAIFDGIYSYIVKDCS